MSDGFGILALDPGVRNYAWVFWRSGVVASGWVDPLSDVTNDTAHMNSLIELLEKYRPSHVVAERYTVRNKGQSVHAEAVNQSLGRLAVLCHQRGIPIVQLMAHTWKTHWNRLGFQWVFPGLETIHQQDAAGIAKYMDEVWIPRNGK